MTRQQRAFLALVCMALLIPITALFVDGNINGNLGYRGYSVGAPERHGAEVVISLKRVVSIEGPNHFTMDNASLTLSIEGPTDGLLVGEEVSVGGIYDAPSKTIRSQWIEHRAEGRAAKRLLGVAGLFLTGCMVLLTVRRDPDGWVLRG